jgi:hypothetical protein
MSLPSSAPSIAFDLPACAAASHDDQVRVCQLDDEFGAANDAADDGAGNAGAAELVAPSMASEWATGSSRPVDSNAA